MVLRTISRMRSRCFVCRLRTNDNYYRLEGRVNVAARQDPSSTDSMALSMSHETPRSLVAFMDDLMFLSRIRDAAEKAGVQVQAVREPAALVEACRVARP